MQALNIKWIELFLNIFMANFVGFAFFWGMALFFALVYYRQKETATEWKCQPKRWCSKEMFIRDIRLGSLNLLLLSTISGIYVYYVTNGGYSSIYYDFSKHGILFSVATGLVYWLFIDGALYWAHRTFHIPYLYKKIHYVHHVNTTPFACTSLAMHTFEAIVYHSLVFIPFMILPVHFLAPIIVLLYTNYVSLLDHSGVKLYSWLPWQEPSQFHDDHHKYFHVNYGQTLGLWDRMFGTWRREGRTYGQDVFGGKGKEKNMQSPRIQYQEPKSIADFLTKHRVLVIVGFCLPISFVFTLFSKISRRLRQVINSRRNHEFSQNLVQEDCKQWSQSPDTQKKFLCTDRKNWMSLSTRFFDKRNYSRIRVSHLTNILSLDKEKMVVRTEPMVTVGQMVDYLNPLGFTLAVTLELREATVGGLAMGTAMTTHSHKVGLFQENVLSYEVVMPSGECLRVTETEHTDLFRTLPWSHGTLGFLVALELRVVPIKPYVRVQYTPVFSQAEYCKKIRELAVKKDTPDFLEATIYSKDKAVIMEGWFDDGKDPQVPLVAINRFYKPWFFKHVETVLTTGARSELIKLKDYVLRHNRAIFWTVQDMIPMGNHPLVRALIGFMYPPNISFLKLSTSPGIRKLTFTKQVFQDLVIPLSALSKGIDLSDELFTIYPLLVYPCKIYDHGKGQGQLRPPRDEDRVPGTNYGMYCDLGIYGVPIAVKENRPFSATDNMQKMEGFIRKEGGYSFLYADSFLTREHFNEMFDLELYDKVRKKYHLDKAFPHLFDKTRPEIDVITIGK